MKLKAASLLELSLALSFAIIGLTITLQLAQESTSRINKAFSFQFGPSSKFLSIIFTLKCDDLKAISSIW